MNARLWSVFAALLVASSQGIARAEVIDREFQLTGATTVRLNVSGRVHVIPDAQVSSVKIHVTDYGPSTPPLTFKSARSGKRVDITVQGPGQNVLPFVGATGYEVEVRVPTNAQIDLREFSGQVTVDAVTAPSQYYNANGNITITDARAKTTAEADNGDISVGAAHGDLSLTTGNGKNTATLAGDWRGNLVRMEASSGAMRLSVPPGFRANFDVTAANGKVSNSLRSSGSKPVVFMLSQQGDITVVTSSPAQ
jgi:hypothetical protein